ncbi:hypothetical protein B0H13DRAFT_1902705 [Mycena leptocephala]|nr:hypothetical protein B0H13DRAFT_1902705 [Mycena leptocephala]
MATDLWDEHNYVEAATEESLAAAGDVEERREPKLKWCAMQCGGEECDGYRGTVARTWSWSGNVIVARDEWMDMAANCWRWENNSWSAGTCQVIASGVLVPATRELGGNARELGPNGSTRAGEQV